MTVLHINAGPDGLCLHRHPRPLPQLLARGLRGDGPVIIMVHGYKFFPGHETACPHRNILSMRPVRTGRKVLSWPRELGFGGANAGLGIAFGWQARGTIWQAYDQAEHMGKILADLVTMIRRIAPLKPVHAIAHSLGARLVLRALPHLAAGALNRIILLSGAEFGSQARRSLNSDAGHTAEVINVTSRENDFYDFLLSRLINAHDPDDRPLGQTRFRRANTVCLRLDDLRTLALLSRSGLKIAAPTARVCHWSTYTRPGVFELYRALLRDPERFDLNKLRVMQRDPPKIGQHPEMSLTQDTAVSVLARAGRRLTTSTGHRTI